MSNSVYLYRKSFITTERVRIGNSPPKVARACALFDHRGNTHFLIQGESTKVTFMSTVPSGMPCVERSSIGRFKSLVANLFSLAFLSRESENFSRKKRDDPEVGNFR